MKTRTNPKFKPGDVIVVISPPMSISDKELRESLVGKGGIIEYVVDADSSTQDLAIVFTDFERPLEIWSHRVRRASPIEKRAIQLILNIRKQR